VSCSKSAHIPCRNLGAPSILPANRKKRESRRADSNRFPAHYEFYELAYSHPTATVKSIEPAVFMDQAGSNYVLAGRVLHVGSIIMTYAVERTSTCRYVAYLSRNLGHSGVVHPAVRCPVPVPLQYALESSALCRGSAFSEPRIGIGVWLEAGPLPLMVKERAKVIREKLQQKSKALTRARSQIRLPAISSSSAGTTCRFNGYDQRCRAPPSREESAPRH
jgi:hypothetical protein